MSFESRLIPPNQRFTTLSPLMAAKAAGLSGNFCPFGCGDDDVDEHGYCYHLIGFTFDEKRKRFETMKQMDNGHVAVQVPFTTKRLGPKHVKRVYQYEKVQPGDQLVEISTSSRVYRNIPRPDDWEDELIQVPDEDDEDDTDE